MPAFASKIGCLKRCLSQQDKQEGEDVIEDDAKLTAIAKGFEEKYVSCHLQANNLINYSWMSIMNND